MYKTATQINDTNPFCVAITIKFELRYKKFNTILRGSPSLQAERQNKNVGNVEIN